MNEAATQYVQQGRVFLTQAADEFARGDLMQASEKGWGAAAQLVKATAAERGWRHGQHRLLFDAVRRLAEEVGEADLRAQFAIASDLHANFDEGYLPAPDVEHHLGHVAAFVEGVESILANGAAANG